MDKIYRFPSSLIWLAIFCVIGLDSFFIVNPGQEALVMRFQKYTHSVNSGLNFKIPFAEKAIIINKSQSRKTNLGYDNQDDIRENNMITNDENIICTQVSVIWNIKDVRNFIMEIDAPEEVLKNTGESVLRDVISSSKLSEIISDKKAEIESLIATKLQVLMDSYHSGIHIIQVQLLKVETPTTDTQNAYREVQAARENKERLINEGLAYKNAKIQEAKTIENQFISEAQQFLYRTQSETETFVNEIKTYNNFYSSLDSIAQESMILHLKRKYQANIFEGKNINIVPEQIFTHKQV